MSGWSREVGLLVFESEELASEVAKQWHDFSSGESSEDSSGAFDLIEGANLGLGVDASGAQLPQRL
jgi:hypothetical protein